MKADCDIILVGGGLNGCALALALAGTGQTVTMIDSLDPRAQLSDDFDGRGYALALSSKRLLRAIGIWDDIAEHSQPIREIKVTDGRAGEGPSPFVLEFDHAEIEEGPMGYMLEDRFLRRAFHERITASENIELLSAQTVTDHTLRDGGVTVTLATGETRTGLLLVGCDGAASATARREGIRRMEWSYRQTALVCAIEHEKPHHGVAHQFFMPSGPLAILPLPGDRSSIVWTEDDVTAAHINALDDTAYLAALKPRFGSFLGDIGLAGARFTYPLFLSVAHRFVSPRVALLGDAAHRVHPIAGQGLNAGLKDVGALAEVVTLAARRGEDIGRLDVLERYQRWRRFDTASLALATDTFNRMFSNDNSLIRAVRDFGMGAVNAMPSLRRRFIREAAGLTGDLPKLLQGRQI